MGGLYKTTYSNAREFLEMIVLCPTNIEVFERGEYV